MIALSPFANLIFREYRGYQQAIRAKLSMHLGDSDPGLQEAVAARFDEGLAIREENERAIEVAEKLGLLFVI